MGFGLRIELSNELVWAEVVKNADLGTWPPKDSEMDGEFENFLSVWLPSPLTSPLPCMSSCSKTHRRGSQVPSRSSQEKSFLLLQHAKKAYAFREFLV